jgi:outer membrane protein
MKSVFSLVVISFLVASSVWAQQPITLTLDSAVQIALDRNYTVLVNKNSIDRDEAAEEAAFGNFLPTLSFGGGFSRSQSWRSNAGQYQLINGIPVYTGGTSFQAFNSYTAGLQAGVTFFNGFAHESGLTEAKQTTESATQTYTWTKQSTIFQTHSMFLAVVADAELVKVYQDNLARDQKQLEEIEESMKVGASAISDVYKQRATVENDQYTLINEQNIFETAKANLLSYLGVDLSQTYQIDFTGIPTDIDTTEFEQINKQYSDSPSLVNQAMAVRPDYLSSIAALNSAEEGVSVAKAAYYPTVSGSAEYGYNDPTLSGITNSKSLSLGLTVALPIFNGFQTQTGVQQAEVARDNAEEALKQNERQVNVDIRKALLDLGTAEKEITSSKIGVVSADMDRQIAEEKYHLGSATLLDLVTAQAEYTLAMENKVNAVNAFLLAKKELELAQGNISK